MLKKNVKTIKSHHESAWCKLQNTNQNKLI